MQCHPPTQPGRPGGQRDEGEVYQQPIGFRSGSGQVSMSVEEVSLHFLGGDPIPYIGLVPIMILEMIILITHERSMLI